jgi:hypothetical protein
MALFVTIRAQHRDFSTRPKNFLSKGFNMLHHAFLAYSIGRKIAALVQVMDRTSDHGLIRLDRKLRLALALTL